MDIMDIILRRLTLKLLRSVLWRSEEQMNQDNLSCLLQNDPPAKLLDLGCGTGELTAKWAEKVGTQNAYGVDIDDGLVNKAKIGGIKCIKADLNQRLPLDSNCFDVVISNQVIEHLLHTDIFVEEIRRILKPGGYAVISTENLSSWLNIFALVLGYRPFSMHYTSKYFGNPLSRPDKEETGSAAMTHIRVFAYKPFKDFFELYGFKVESFLGTGYFPMPLRFLAKLMCKIDPRHSHFMTIKVRK